MANNLKRLMAFVSFVSATMAHANDDIVCDFRVGINCPVL